MIDIFRDSTPVSFWCSRCRFDHAGECVLVAKAPPVNQRLVNNWPPIGTKWRSKVTNPDSSISTSVWTYEVIEHDTSLMKVKVRAFDRDSRYKDDRYTPVSAWQPAGMTFQNGAYRGQQMWMVDP